MDRRSIPWARTKLKQKKKNLRSWFVFLVLIGSVVLRNAADISFFFSSSPSSGSFLPSTSGSSAFLCPPNLKFDRKSNRHQEKVDLYLIPQIRSPRGHCQVLQGNLNIDNDKKIDNLNPNFQNQTSKGFRILEWTNQLLPQSILVKTAKFFWNLIWKVFMTELAPQSKKDGSYVRPKYTFNKKIEMYSSSRSTEVDPFPLSSKSNTSVSSSISEGREKILKSNVEANRYHLYLGNPCPWCHRIGLVLALKQIPEEIVSVTKLVDDAERASRGGWCFDSAVGSIDPLFNAKDLREVYDTCTKIEHLDRFRKEINDLPKSENESRLSALAGKLSKLEGDDEGEALQNLLSREEAKDIPGYTGRCTAPLLVDKKKKIIINNESSDIMRYLNDIKAYYESVNDTIFEFEKENTKTLDKKQQSLDLYPKHLQDEIDKMNEKIYQLNNGVYRCGFASSQDGYNSAIQEVNEILLWLENEIFATEKKNNFVLGEKVTESDLRLFPTIIRYDAVYNSLFKCKSYHIKSDLPNVYAWMIRMYKIPGIAETIDIKDAANSYYRNLFPLNPGSILPLYKMDSNLIGNYIASRSFGDNISHSKTNTTDTISTDQRIDFSQNNRTGDIFYYSV